MNEYGGTVMNRTAGFAKNLANISIVNYNVKLVTEFGQLKTALC